MGVPDLNVLGKKPFNAEPSSLVELTNHPITPLRLVYARNHSEIVDRRPDVQEYTVKVDADGDIDNIDSLVLTFVQVRDMPQKDVVATLICAGNRRAKMAEKTGRAVDGVSWSEGTIANVRWTGALLRDILLRAGVPDDDASWKDLHACFASHIAPCDDDTYYGGSIPLEKAMCKDGEVLLAYEMNGEPLTPDHGYPLRVVVPGYGGMRWVKWVDRITISRQESPNFYQKTDYRMLPEYVTSKQMATVEGWWSKVPAMQNLPCNSVVTSFKKLRSSCPEEMLLKTTGYAYSDCPVQRVDVSVDHGATWTQCDIKYQQGQWSWALWEGCIKLVSDENVDAMFFAHNRDKIPLTVLSRTTDSAGRVQELTFPWNLRGVGYAGAGEATINV